MIWKGQQDVSEKHKAPENIWYTSSLMLASPENNKHLHRNRTFAMKKHWGDL